MIGAIVKFFSSNHDYSVIFRHTEVLVLFIGVAFPSLGLLYSIEELVDPSVPLKVVVRYRY